jgi:hypothetical protein
MGRMIWGFELRSEFFFLRNLQTEFGAHTVSYTVWTGPPSLEKSGQGPALTTHP